MNSLRYIFLSLLFLFSCSSSVQDGDYCANIDRYNPRTQNMSNYKLTVVVIDEKLTKIFWPNGGYIDEGEFEPPDISNRQTSFSTFNDVQYKVRLVGKAENCFDETQRLVRCSAKTKDGTRCKNKTGDESGMCWRHR